MMNREKVINKYNDVSFITGYLDEDDEFIFHSFDDEPASIWNDGYKSWYKDGLLHRDNNLPAAIWSDGRYSFYKNGKKYWIINDTEYYSYEEVKEKFKNNILKLKNVNVTILKENGIVDVIHLRLFDYLILDQSQYNLAILKFL